MSVLETWDFARWSTSVETRSALRQLLTGDARSASVLAGSLLDDLLGRLIESGPAPAAGQSSSAAGLSYSDKCRIARESGAVGERLFRDLRTLGWLRNEFAHNPDPDLDYESPRMTASVAGLRSPLNVAGATQVSEARERLRQRYPFELGNSRYWWTIAVIAVIAVLGVRIGKPVPRRAWPG